MMPKIASYGAWDSPIAAQTLVADAVGLGAIQRDGAAVYWLESRPQEKGRSVVVRNGEKTDPVELTPAPWNVRSRVHEYGGGAYGVNQGSLYFVNQADQQVYYGNISSPITSSDFQALTATPTCRYANGIWDRGHDRLIFVQEDHQAEAVINQLVAVALPDQSNGATPWIPPEPTVLVTGADFYSSPALSPDGQWLAWLSWNHPQMPWEGCQLWCAPVLSSGELGAAQLVAGSQQESVGQPRWFNATTLIFISDRSGWGQPYQWQPPNPNTITPLLPQALEAEFGTPHWVFGQSTYGIIDSNRILFSLTHQGLGQLGLLQLSPRQWDILDLPFTDFSSLQASPDTAYFVATSPNQPAAVIALDLHHIGPDTTSFKILKQSTHLTIAPDYFSTPQALCFPTSDAAVAYGFYYPPHNRDCVGPTTEKPPLIVKCHGGPTAATSTGFNLGIQYWTSRGFAVLDVNYRGSTGYGRAYQDALQSQWGIYDVADCVAGVNYLGGLGWIDPDKVAIRGSSAGGYTTLAALTFTNTFQAGASYYGVGDLAALATDTHKFEAHYLDGLVGPYPQAEATYLERSPLAHVARLNCPVIFFQGLEDRVVPPNQAEMMVQALDQKGIPVAYLTFATEAHGFRQAETIIQTLEAELYFYGKIFGFTPAGDLPPIPIRHL